MLRKVCNYLKNRKVALALICATLLLHLAFAIGTRCHVLEQLITGLFFLAPTLPFIFTKVPVASSVSCITLWPFIFKANNIDCIYNSGGYYMGSLPTFLSGVTLAFVVGIIVLIFAHPRHSS